MNIAILFIILILVIVVVFFAYKQGIFGGGIDEAYAEINAWKGNTETRSRVYEFDSRMYSYNIILKTYMIKLPVDDIENVIANIKDMAISASEQYFSYLPNLLELPPSQQNIVLMQLPRSKQAISLIVSLYNKLVKLKDKIRKYLDKKPNDVYMSTLYSVLDNSLTTRKSQQKTGRFTKPALRKQYSDDDEAREATF